MQHKDNHYWKLLWETQTKTRDPAFNSKYFCMFSVGMRQNRKLVQVRDKARSSAWKELWKEWGPPAKAYSSPFIKEFCSPWMLLALSPGRRTPRRGGGMCQHPLDFWHQHSTWVLLLNGDELLEERRRELYFYVESCIFRKNVICFTNSYDSECCLCSMVTKSMQLQGFLWTTQDIPSKKTRKVNCYMVVFKSE